MRLKFLPLLFFVILGTADLSAQRTHSFSIGGGISYYYGDLTDKFNNVFVRPSATASYSYYFQPNLRFRLGAAYSQIGAADSLANDPARVDRNLHFRSDIYEASATVVYEFIRDKRFGISWISKPHISPYVFGGVALFSYNPRAQLDGEWYDLQPLGTEGQFIEGGDYPDPYSRLQVSLPVGAGITIRFMDYIGASFEIGQRTTLTDYLDDVSTNYPDLGQLAETSGTIAASLSNRSGNLNNNIAKREILVQMIATCFSTSSSPITWTATPIDKFRESSSSNGGMESPIPPFRFSKKLARGEFRAHTGLFRRQVGYLVFRDLRIGA